MLNVLLILLVVDIIFNIVSTILITINRRTINELSMYTEKNLDDISNMIDSIIDIVEK